jgi:hypothetical protein
MATNRHSDNLAIWSHITSGLLASWINDKNSQNEVKIKEIFKVDLSFLIKK